MFSSKVVLWGGLASAFGGVFWLMIGLAPSGGEAGVMLALVLGLGGLAALYSLQAGHARGMGLAGFALGVVGTVLALAALWWGSSSGRFTPASDASPVAPVFLMLCLGMALLGLGLALLGTASLRANTLHRWRGLPLGLGLLSIIQGMAIWLVFYVPLSQGRNPWNPWNPEAYVLPFGVFVLLGLGWMGLGITLMSESDAKVAQPTASV